MANKFLRVRTYICASILLIPAYSFACETAGISTLEQEKSGLSALNSEAEHASLYNFRSKRCTPLEQANNELEVSTFLPSDETSQGMYQLYRDKGENKVDALKHALEFMIKEQQS